METREYRTVNKDDWGTGPWKNEPDKVQWQDDETGLPCLIVRGPGGALCGYVGVSEGHPAFEKSYSDEVIDVRVHGGLTFADHCHAGSEDSAICHIPGEGEADNVWWLGFDCAHSNDIAPKSDAQFKELGFAGFSDWPRTYRDLDYVKNEVRDLARQLHAMEA